MTGKIHIKKGDEVVVVCGRDKGKSGQVTKVLLKQNRVIIQGVATVKRHTAPSANNPGGIIEKEAPIHLSNIALYNPNRKRGDRSGMKTLEDGRKVRVFRSDDEVVDIA